MIEVCPNCKVYSLNNRICDCCGYIANKSNANAIPAFKPNEYSVQHHTGRTYCLDDTHTVERN